MAERKNTRGQSPGTEEAAGRFVEQLFDQLKSLLPIKSMDALLEGAETIRIGSSKIPTELLAPHVDSSIFPIEDDNALRKVLDTGVSRAVQFGSSVSFHGRHPALDEVTAAVTQREAFAELAIPASYWLYNTSPPVESEPHKRPKTGQS